MEYKINFDSSQIIKLVKRPKGTSGKLINFFECKCKNENCKNLTYRVAGEKIIWSGYCRPCSNRIKLQKARLVPNPSDGKPYEALFSQLIKCAKRKNNEVKLTYEEFVEFTKVKNCHYCYQPLKWAVRNLAKNGSRYNLDRVDNNKGYEKDNCVPCCWKCNNGRRNLFSYEEWYGMTEYFRKINRGNKC